jgi:flagellar protein FlbD
MIRLTRLQGETFYLNEELIERIEKRRDTTLVLVGGNVYTVAEAPEEVADAILQLKATVRSLASRMGTTKAGLRVVSPREEE